MDVSEPRVVVTDSTQDSVAIGELQKQPDLPVGSESSAAVVNTTSSSGFAATVCSTSTSTSVVTSVSESKSEQIIRRTNEALMALRVSVPLLVQFILTQTIFLELGCGFFW